MKKLLPSIILILFAGFFQLAKAQNISNEGMEFWTVFPTHVPNANSPATMNVNVTSKSNTEVTVSCGTYSETKPVRANTVVTFLVDRPQSYIDGVTDGNRKLTNRGIHIVVTPNMPKIVAYSHVFASARSAATLILPVDALGQKYYSMNYDQDNTGQNFMVFVAAEDNTDLLLHKMDGTTTTIETLNKGDVYEYIKSGEDLTGSFIETAASSSCEIRFAAFSGSSAVRIGGNSGGIDPLLQQLYAINSWGKKYGVIPFINRRYIVRVLAQEDNTTVNFDGISGGVINKGKFVERSLSVPTIITSDKLISVAEYSYTQEFSSPTGGALSIGDPEMVLLNPVEFNIKNITLFASRDFRIDEKYINVFMKTAKTSTFKLNGSLPSNGSWQPVASDPSYSYIQIRVNDISLILTSDDGFNAIAYGFGDHESYAYSAGTSLASTQYLLFLNKSTNEENATACIGQPSDLKITLPYELIKLVWNYEDGTTDEVLNPPYTTSGTDPILYTYTSPVSKTFTVLGPKHITALATLSASAGSCYGSEIELPFNFNVDPLPQAGFTMAAATGCTTEAIAFTDASQVNGKVLTKWLWDFGDPASGALNTYTSILPSVPPHVYTTSGTYTVKLSVGAENGCMSDVFEQNITINPKPEAKFTLPADFCVNRELEITNLSTIAADGSITYSWEFDDGSAPINTNTLTPPVFSYTTPGSKTIKLTVTSDKGCVSDVFSQNINIVALPTVDFETPGYCKEDVVAIFKNLSKDYDGTTTNLKFEWDYGDGTPSTGPSAIYNGEHTYTTPGVPYTVTLRVYNQFGCVADIKTKPFTVNGSFPKADFEILNANNLCSNQSFTLKNISTVDFGNITKVQWYIDDEKYGDDDLDPTFDKLYDFTYPQFTTPLTKTLKVKMMVYSGAACSDEIIKDVILLASPVVKFDALEPICLNGREKQLIATETGGFEGTGTFSGEGVSPTGMFNPLVAGVGLHTITYTFNNSTNGCSDFKKQLIRVYPIPSVDAGQDVYILAGGEKQLPATASGNGLTYKWTPNIGLSAYDILNPIASPAQDTRYTLTVTSSQNCTTVDDIYVHVLQSVNAPNTFTPNGDGVNDVWNVKYLDTYPNGTVEVYDRSGQRVFFSRGYAVPFDGNYNNKPLPVGVYYYIINPNNGRKTITGSLTIIR